MVYAALDVPRPTDDAKARAPDGAPERGGGNGVLVARSARFERLRIEHGGIGRRHARRVAQLPNVGSEEVSGGERR